MKKNQTDIFSNAPVPKAVILNIVPSIVSMIMVLLYNLADTFFIGQTHNALMVAAVSITTPVFMMFLAVGFLFGIGGTSLISRTLGEGNEKKAKNVSAFCFWTGGTIGVIAMVLIWIFSKQICTTVGASSDTLGFAVEYLDIVAFAIPFLIISGSFSNIIRAEGNPNIAMAGSVMGNLLNMVLDPILILGFGWNVAGAAIATVIGNIFSATFYIVHLSSKKSILSVKPKDFRIKNGVAFGVLAIGVPASMNHILMSTSNIILNNMMSQYGDMAVAGLGVAMKVNMIVVMLLIGIGTGIQPLLGYCFGAKNKKRYLDILKFSTVLALCLSFIMTFVCYHFAPSLVKAFLNNPAAFVYGIQFSRLYMLSGPIMGILFVLINAIQATGAAIPALVLSISRQGLIYIPILLIINKMYYTAPHLAQAQPIADYCAAVLAVILFIITYKVYFKNFEQKV